MAKAVVDERFKATEEAISQIRSKFGDGSIMRLGEAKKMQVDAIPTGCLSLDLALGIGGVPRGRIVEIYGPESSGKTTLAQHVIAEVQKLGGLAAFVDAEHALDPAYAEKIGVKINDMLISQPDTGEQALDIVETLVRSGAVDVIVVDSVAALVPKAEIEGEMGDSHMGLQARLMSQALRKLTGIVSKTKTCVIFINQTRMKIGVVFGNPETTTGGNALKFYASMRVEVRRSAQLKKDDKVIGNQVNVKVVKNKVAPPFRTTQFEIMYNEGISLAGDMLDTGVLHEVISKNGNSYTYGAEKLGVGRENAKTFLRENPKLMKQIRAEVMAKISRRGGHLPRQGPGGRGGVIGKRPGKRRVFSFPLLHGALAVRLRAAAAAVGGDVVVVVGLAVVDGELLARADVPRRHVEDAPADGVRLEIRPAAVVHVARQVASRRAVDIHVLLHLEDVTVRDSVRLGVVDDPADVLDDAPALPERIHGNKTEAMKAPARPEGCLLSGHRLRSKPPGSRPG